MGELFYWVVMVVFGGYLIYCVLDGIRDMLKGELLGMFVSFVFAIIAWNIHKWAFVKLVPLQTLF